MRKNIYGIIKTYTLSKTSSTKNEIIIAKIVVRDNNECLENVVDVQSNSTDRAYALYTILRMNDDVTKKNKNKKYIFRGFVRLQRWSFPIGSYDGSDGFFDKHSSRRVRIINNNIITITITKSVSVKQCLRRDGGRTRVRHAAPRGVLHNTCTHNINILLLCRHVVCVCVCVSSRRIDGRARTIYHT